MLHKAIAMAKKVKSKKGANGKKKAKPIVVRAAQVVPPRVALGPHGMAYAQLLMDPCNAPMAHPVYGGVEAGYLFRASSFTTIGTGTGETAGLVHWTPGAIGTGANEFIIGFAAGHSTTLTTIGNNGAPGRDFLLANASVYRCVAACLQISYPGTEANRAGRVHYGHGSGNNLDAGASTTVAAFSQLLPSWERTPVSTIDVVWKPHPGDQHWLDPSGDHSFAKDQRGSVDASFQQVVATGGMTFRLTAVYEWMPKHGLGITMPPPPKNRFSNEWEMALQYIRSRGFRWLRSAAVGYLNQGGGRLTIGYHDGL